MLAPLINKSKGGCVEQSWPQLLAPLEILMRKISLKYISIHIHNVVAHQGDGRTEVPQDYKSEEHKAQIPFKPENIVLMCKIVELHKIECGFKNRVKALKIPIYTTRGIIKRIQSTKDVTNRNIYIIFFYIYVCICVCI